MSDLPDRKEMFHRLPGLQHVDEVVVIEAYVRGILKSRDEMDLDAAARRWLEDDVHTPYSEAVKNLLDAAWGVADE